MKIISILGSTGSIGTQTLDICRQYNLPVEALGAGYNLNLLFEQIKEFRPRFASVANEKLANELQERLHSEKLTTAVYYGKKGLDVCVSGEASIVVAAMVGIAGLEPVIKAIKNKKHIALANKEVLVSGGALVNNLCKDNSVSLLPVDSEHSAIWQCIADNDTKELKKLWLTASGGPFLYADKETIVKASAKEALKHPNWNMGGKISIDSATMMNKGLEIIEAMHLFSVNAKNIEVVIHPQSVIHSMVEWQDGSVIAQLGEADMRLPIQLALSYPKRWHNSQKNFEPWFLADGKWTFLKPDFTKFPALTLAYEAAREKKSLAIVMNAANEVAVSAFLQGRISFPQIISLVEKAMSNHINEGTEPALSLEAIMYYDKKTRLIVENEL